ncbi:MAG: GHKL domain-containing protein [Oscillospiraceae bacterium]|nr:GHKL domain-containing protein [Oscillospiraceae bacterium]
MAMTVLFVLWWLLVNSAAACLDFLFLQRTGGREDWKSFPLWLAVHGGMTLLAVCGQLPGMFFGHVLVSVLCTRWVLGLRWTELAAPLTLIFTLSTMLEGGSALLLSWASSQLQTPSGGLWLQLLVPLLTTALYALALYLVQRKPLGPAKTAQLPMLFLPCTGLVLAIRCAFRLDTRIFEGYLRAMAVHTRLGILSVLLGGTGVVFVLLGAFRRLLVLTGREAAVSAVLAGQRTAEGRKEAWASFRHDLNNHLLVLSGLIAGEHYSAAAHYADRLYRRCGAVFPLSTGSPALDALLGEKLGAAQRAGIQVTCQVHLPDGLLVDELDLCALFANLIDNALTACQTVLGPRQLSLQTNAQARCLVLTVVNTADCTQPIQAGTGLRTVQRIAEEYQGTVSLVQGEGHVQVSVLLCAR